MGNLNRKITKRKGVALLITLSVMLLLSIILTEGMQKTSIELRLIENEDSRFKLEVASISVLTAFTEGLKLVGANKIYQQLIQFEDGFPLTDEIVVQNIKIWPMDHFVVINSVFNGSSGAILIQLLTNIFNNLPKGIEQKESYYNQLFGSIADFIDGNEDIFNDNYLIGEESYPDSRILFSVKNKELDMVSELNILPIFQEIGFVKHPNDIYEIPIRVLKKSSFINTDCKVGPLNINMVPYLDIEKFKAYFLNYLNVLQNIPTTGNECEDYHDLLYQNRDLILDALWREFDSVPFQPFGIPLKNDSRFVDIIESITSSRSLIEGFFSARSNLIGLSFQIETRGLIQNIVVNFQLDYKNSTSEIPEKIKIVYYKVF